MKASTLLAGDTLTCLQALAEPKRLLILEALRGGERCVCRLTESLGMDQPLLSHHLRVLRDAGLVAGRKDGRWVYYSLVPEALEELQAALAELREDGTDTELCLDHC